MRKDFISQFETLPLVSKQVMLNAASRLDISLATLNSHIARSLDTKDLISLKRGYYVSGKFYNEHKSELDYVFYIGNKLLEPSYVSMESAMQYYGLMAEANNSVITSITTSTTRKFQNRLGNFKFNNIKGDLFGDFENLKVGFDFFIAKPYKAIFDFLFFRLSVTELRDRDKVLYYLEDFRIDYDQLSDSDLQKLFSLCNSL